MSIDSLHKRIDTLLARIEQQLLAAQPGHQSLETLFTEQERAVFHALLEQIEPRLVEVSGHLDYSKVTDAELEQLETWCLLSKALGSGDTTAAETYRRSLVVQKAA